LAIKTKLNENSEKLLEAQQKKTIVARRSMETVGTRREKREQSSVWPDGSAIWISLRGSLWKFFDAQRCTTPALGRQTIVYLFLCGEKR
jgi:hypothetical protein